MKTLRLLAIVLIAILALGVSKASAIPATLTVTADNVYYTIAVNGVDIYPLGANYNNWMVADSYNIDLNYMAENIIDFTVVNAGASSNLNPAALLAQLTLNADCWFKEGGKTIYSADEPYWSISTSSFGHIPQTPTSYGRNDDPTTIWNVGNNGPIAGISGAAEWIWSSNNFSSAGDRGAIVSLKVTPVPEPATMLLLGPALGILAMRRKKIIS